MLLLCNFHICLYILGIFNSHILPLNIPFEMAIPNFAHRDSAAYFITVEPSPTIKTSSSWTVGFIWKVMGFSVAHDGVKKEWVNEMFGLSSEVLRFEVCISTGAAGSITDPLPCCLGTESGW